MSPLPGVEARVINWIYKHRVPTGLVVVPYPTNDHKPKRIYHNARNGSRRIGDWAN